MGKKQKRKIGVVYSTDPDFSYQYENTEEEVATLPADKQKLKVRIDKRRRKGKTVTLIEGFVGTETDLKALGKQLKTKCGVGGSAKDGEILLQGDFKTKVVTWLKNLGYSKARAI